MTSPEEIVRRMTFCRARAAQAWCAEKTSMKEMDVDLAEEFAKILLSESYAHHLGCATTREIIDELAARSNLDYKTVSDGN